MSGAAEDQNVVPVNESPLPAEMTVKEYALTRFSSLRPPMNLAPNPLELLAMLNQKQWTFFLVAFLAWVCFSSLVDFSGVILTAVY